MGQKISMMEAAQEYGVALSTIRRYIAEGRLTAYRIGPRMIRLDADQLHAGLLGQQVDTAPGRRAGFFHAYGRIPATRH